MYFQLLFYLRKKVKHAKKDVTINLPLDSNLLMTSCKLAIMTRPSRTSREGQRRGNVVHRLQPYTR